MTDHAALLESALDSLPQGVALLDRAGGLVFWNQAAAAMTGFSSADVLGQAIPEALQPLLDAGARGQARSGAGVRSDRGVLVHARHKLGHEMAAIARTVTLHDGLGAPIGMATVFHPAQRLDALPLGESTGSDGELQASQADLDERLQSEFEDFERGGQTLGVVWIAVDQAPDLRRSHGAAACQAMMERMGRALAAGVRPAEELGRWGDDEFLVIAHERTPEMLAAHAHTLAGVARTAEFRWWGDRVSLTVSIGAAQAEPGDDLSRLLKRARHAMETSARQGGNCVTFAQPQFEEDMEPTQGSGRAQ